MSTTTPRASGARRRGWFEPRLVAVCAGYAFRACFPTKRRIGLALPAAGAVLFALLARLIPDPAPLALAEVANGGLFGVVLPVGCLVIGDAVLGSEVRAGTLHFTWLSPASYTTIVAGRWLAGAAVAVAALAVPFGVAAVVAGVPEAIGPLALAAVAGAAAYVAVFVLLGALTRRPSSGRWGSWSSASGSSAPPCRAWPSGARAGKRGPSTPASAPAPPTPCTAAASPRAAPPSSAWPSSPPWPWSWPRCGSAACASPARPATDRAAGTAGVGAPGGAAKPPATT